MQRSTKRILYNVIIVCFLAGGLICVFSRFVHWGNVEYTDNARIHQYITPVHTRVSGFIRKVCFEEFRPVRKGDTLFVIDDAEFRLRLAQAEADLANAVSASQAVSAGIVTTRNNLRVSDAGLEEARVRMENAAKEWKRFEALIACEAVTRQQYESVKTVYDAAAARYEQLRRAKYSTTLVRDEQTHRLGQSEAGVCAAEAALDLARLNLSYTVILATCDGVMGRKEIHEGQLVQSGQVLANIVDGSELWVVANYRETQMKNIHEGAAVKLTADAVPGITYIGEVESISDATGASFSMIPQDNAAGNFVKVEQRIPVRILLRGNRAEDLARLKAGFNVECEVKY